MAIRTRLTEYFGIEHPIVLAPMTLPGGVELAAAVADAGGLGLLGGSYGDRTWFAEVSEKVTRRDLGCGFVTWSVARDLGLFLEALERFPRAMMLSFADPALLARHVKEAGVPLICQVHTLDQAFRAIDVGANAIVAQGTEAGGHGMSIRSTMSFVPEVVDAVSKRAPEVLVLAAGGVADGRGLAASLMLGADGVLVGTRFWATEEALIHPLVKAKAIATSGDGTIRTSVYDVVRRREWPAGYTGRLLKNEFIEKWYGREGELALIQQEELRKVQAASECGDYGTANVTIGESVGLVSDFLHAGDLVQRMAAQAAACLALGRPNLSMGDPRVVATTA